MTRQEQETAVKAAVSLGEAFRRGRNDERLGRAMDEAARQNPWFTEESLQSAISEWGRLLNEEEINRWVSAYALPREKKDVALVLAGNIPLVGLHDILSVYLSGHRALIKPSSSDTALINYAAEHLMTANPAMAANIEITAVPAKGVDAVIATGSDNTARYFEQYFKDIPALIRRSRASVAVVSEETTDEDLSLLAGDIMKYFGMGCRSISLVFLPAGFDIRRLIRALEPYHGYISHHKYANNYDYQRALYSMTGGHGVYDTGFLILAPGDTLRPPLGALSYEYYDNPEKPARFVMENASGIQCVAWEGFPGGVRFGMCQSPGLTDYADGEDTMAFLSSLA